MSIFNYEYIYAISFIIRLHASEISKIYIYKVNTK